MIHLKISLLILASAIKCFKCSNEKECESPDLVECSAEEAKETATVFSFLPKSQSQAESTIFNCAAYNAELSTFAKQKKSSTKEVKFDFKLNQCSTKIRGANLSKTSFFSVELFKR